MKHTFIKISCAALLIAASVSNGYAFNLDQNLLNKTIQQQDNVKSDTNSIVSSLSNSLTNEQLNPLVTLAATQLGVPSEYLPQLQALYQIYKDRGNLISADILSMKTLTNWLNSTEALDPTSLANNLNTIFSKS